MFKSVKQYLIIGVLVILTLVCSIAIFVTFAIKHDEVKPHLDAQLAYAAISLETFVEDSEDIKSLKSSIEYIPYRLETVNYRGADNRDVIRSHIESIQFQVIIDGKLVLRSPGAPEKILDLPDGYGYYINKTNNWRTFVLSDTKKNIKIYVIQPHNLRLYYEKRVAYTSVIVISIIFAVLLILILMIINRGVSNLFKIASEIKSRDHNNLKPIERDNIPSEIMPIVDDLNNLLHQLSLALSREKSFAGNAAHELRTPLATLKLQAQLALSISDEQEVREILEEIIGSVNRQTHVVSQLLTLSRMMPESLSSHHSKFHLNDLILNQIHKVEHDAKVKNISIYYSENFIEMIGHFEALEVSIRNLLDNAIKYSDANATIHLEISKQGKNIHIDVKDTGPGIPDKHKGKVFERFYRILGNTVEGTGLGLNIVKQVIEFHHGKIKIVDNYPKGTHIHLEIPQEQPH